MPNIAAGIGPAIATFIQMRQLMAQEHAQREAERATKAAGLGLMNGGGGAPAAAPGAPPSTPPNPLAALAALGGGGGAPQPAPDNSNTPDPAAAPHPMAGPPPVGQPGLGGGQSPPPSPQIASIIQALSGMGATSPMPGGPAAGAPPPQPAAPPPRDPNVSAAAEPTGQGFHADSMATLRSMMQSISKANPGLRPEVAMQALQQQITLMKGIEPDTRSYLQAEVATARIQQQADAAVQRANSATEAAQIRSDAALAVANARATAAEEIARGRNEQSDTNNIRTTSTSRGNTRFRGGVSERGQDLQHGDRVSAEGGRNNRASTTEGGRNQRFSQGEAGKNSRAEVAQGRPATASSGGARPKPTAQDRALAKSNPGLRAKFRAHFGIDP